MPVSRAIGRSHGLDTSDMFRARMYGGDTVTGGESGGRGADVPMVSGWDERGTDRASEEAEIRTARHFKGVNAIGAGTSSSHGRKWLINEL